MSDRVGADGGDRLALFYPDYSSKEFQPTF